jgi:hypothetical protein
MPSDAEKLRAFAKQIRDLRTSVTAVSFETIEAAKVFVEASEQLEDTEIYLETFGVSELN